MKEDEALLLDFHHRNYYYKNMYCKNSNIWQAVEAASQELTQFVDPRVAIARAQNLEKMLEVAEQTPLIADQLTAHVQKSDEEYVQSMAQWWQTIEALGVPEQLTSELVAAKERVVMAMHRIVDFLRDEHNVFVENNAIASKLVVIRDGNASLEIIHACVEEILRSARGLAYAVLEPFLADLYLRAVDVADVKNEIVCHLTKSSEELAGEKFSLQNS